MILHLYFDPQIVREFHKGSVHHYRVHVESDCGVTPETIDYLLAAKCKEEPKEGSAASVEFRFTHFKASIVGHTLHKSLLGDGPLQVAGAGFPTDFKTKLETETFWYPVLTWFLPSEIKDGRFDVSETLGGGSTFTGSGTLKRDEFEVTGKLLDGRGATLSVKLAWQVGADGWVVSGDGTIVAPAGTVVFTINE